MKILLSSDTIDLIPVTNSEEGRTFHYKGFVPQISPWWKSAILLDGIELPTDPAVIDNIIQLLGQRDYNGDCSQFVANIIGEGLPDRLLDIVMEQKGKTNKSPTLTPNDIISLWNQTRTLFTPSKHRPAHFGYHLGSNIIVSKLTHEGPITFMNLEQLNGEDGPYKGCNDVKIIPY